MEEIGCEIFMHNNNSLIALKSIQTLGFPDAWNNASLLQVIDSYIED